MRSAEQVDGDAATRTADQDVTVELTYSADSQVATRKAKNSTTGDQTTTYVYGVTTTAGSDLAHNGLLRAVIYPDSDDVTSPLRNGADSTYDRVELKYNRLGEPIERKDQNETVHVLEYDKLGRQNHDARRRCLRHDARLCPMAVRESENQKLKGKTRCLRSAEP